MSLVLHGMGAVLTAAAGAAGSAESAAAGVETAAAESLLQVLERYGMTTASEGVKALMPALGRFFLHLLGAGLLILVGIRLIKWVGKLARRSFERLNMQPALSRFLSSCLSALLYGILIFAAADMIGISSASIIALLGSAGIAIGLALQGSLSNFAGGVLILLVKPFVIGDYIVCESGEGTVTGIGIIYTTLLTIDNQKVVLPNAALSNSPLTNMTASERRRLIISVCIGYDADLKQAKEILQRLFTADRRILENEGIEVYVDSLSENGVVLKARGWTKTDDYWQAKWDLTEQIKLAFDEAGIVIPYQRLELHVRQDANNAQEERKRLRGEK